MDELAARCPDCGFRHETEFAPCPVCGRAEVSHWWCGLCSEWCPRRVCPGCAGLISAPAEIHLGPAPPGTRVPVKFTVRNAGRKPVEVPVSADPVVTLAARRIILRPGTEATVLGVVAVGHAPFGRLRCAVRFGTPDPVETNLVVEVVPPVVALAIAPTELALRNVTPGKTAQGHLTLRNTGNVSVSAAVAASQPWLSATPEKVELGPGGLVTLVVWARTRKSEYGTRTAEVRATAPGGVSCEARVRVVLPEPELRAGAVDFGIAHVGRPAYASVSLRNVGKVRVACTLACDQPWLAVAPGKLNLPPGKEKVLKLRALLSAAQSGPVRAGVVVSLAGSPLLLIPVSAVCRVPRPVLGPVRRRSLGAVADDAPVVRRFRVANTGDGRLDCTISAEEPWVEVLTPELRVAPGKKRRVEFRLNTPAMNRGTNVAVLRVRSNGGDADVPVWLTVVAPDPELEVLGDADLGTVSGDQPARGYLGVRNVGVGMLALRAVAEDDRVTLNPSEMRLAPGPPARVGVSVAVAGLAGGPHTFGVRFSSNGGSDRAAVRFRLPLELIDAPSLIDLGDRPAGRPTGGALRVRNTGPHPVTLTVRADDPLLKPSTEQIAVRPGETVAVPFRLDLEAGVFGTVVSAIRLEGRALRHAVAVRAVARKVELVVLPQTFALGDMTAGEERAVTFQVANNGELTAEIHESHARGELEVWVRRLAVKPGETATLFCRVKLNARTIGRRVHAVMALADQASVVFSATVARPLRLRVVAGLAVVVGLTVGGALGATVGWVLGVALMVIGVVAGGVFFALGGGK
jgi:hypothetical protein